MLKKYQEIKEQFADLEKQLRDLTIISNLKKLAEISRRRAELKEAVEMILELEKIEKNIIENKNLMEESQDRELKNIAEEEVKILEKKAVELKNKIKEELNPANPNDQKNALVEIRAGTGGDESAMFAADLFRLYSRFAEKQGWKLNILNSHRIGLGGFKEIIIEIKGKNAYGHLKYEGGIHRVQRIPETEKHGRVHTSAATVAVLPEAEEVDLEIKNEDLKIDTFASSGPGGQSVNTTNSAVRITHLPTNTTVQCQDQKDQHQNKEKAMQILRSRLLVKLEEEKRAKESSERKQQIGTGDRSEKIRTYNFSQDRVTDHRIKKSWSQIDKILDGQIEDIIAELKKTER